MVTSALNSHGFQCVRRILFCVHCDHVSDCNPSIITCFPPGRDPPTEDIHISSLPPSIPTDHEAEQTEEQGEDVYFVDSFFL